MKCLHLVAMFALAGCGLNTTALPSTGRGAEDAGVSSRGPIAGSPASWPTRQRPSQLAGDGGSGDTKDAGKPNAGPTTSDRDAQTDAASPSGPASPGSAANPSAAQPSSQSGGAKPGSQAQPSGSSSGQNGGSSDGSASSAPDAGWPAPEEPDEDGASDEDEWSSEESQGSGGQAGQPQNNDSVSVIVDLVLAILDLSLGPVRPSELEGLVSSILVLSLAPADLAAESLIAVFDALDRTQICIDHPERCNPLCTNLESDCSACGNDHDCVERIEEMCKVKLPRSCF